MHGCGACSPARGLAPTSTSARAGSTPALAAAGLAAGARRAGGDSFYEKLVAGRLGYREAARFESPIAPFVPEVAESVNRTIIIMERSNK
jgi:hypothetical protein